MRVLQLIDTLHAGGAERVAVNFANSLVGKIDESFICTTRAEGLLKGSIDNDVRYLFLNKKHKIDVHAIKRLLKYIKLHNIDIIHAHSSSFFLATIIKGFSKKTKIIWHDHYGNSEFLNQRKSPILKFCSKYFSQVFCVNRNLEAWSRSYLKIKNASYLPNFAVKNEVSPETNLYGVKNKRIVCLANLRPQKDHFVLIKAFKEIVKIYPDWTLHCVGKDFHDEYSSNLNDLIKTLNLSNNVYLYGSKPDISNILNQCEIGVLSSKSEGLPLAILEYALAKLPVVSTDVGDIRLIIRNNITGILVKKNNELDLKEAILKLIMNKELRNEYLENLSNVVKKDWSESAIITELLKCYNKINANE